MKTQKGITLVALVITIIVLLILAGVSISMALGENGILTRAENAVDKNEWAEEREKIAMAVFAYEMAQYTDDVPPTDVAQFIKDETGFTATGSGNSYSVTGASGAVYTVDMAAGTVTGPDGAQSEVPEEGSTT